MPDGALCVGLRNKKYFLAVASNDTTTCKQNSNVSSDGTVWVASETPSGNWNCVIWAKELGLFIAVGV